MAQLRGMSSGMGRISEPIETLQSRARELEKKAALETVRCEELQLELSAALKSRPGRTSGTSGTMLSGGLGTDGLTGGRGTVGNSCTTAPIASSGAGATLNSIGSSGYGSAHHTSSVTTNASALERSLGGYGGSGVTGGTGNRTLDGIGIGQHSTSIGMSSSSGNTAGSTVTWAPTPTGGHQQGTEIDRIMAKIEQDNRILAELEHPRTTGPIMSSALGTGALSSVSTSLGLSAHQTHLHQTPSSLASQISTSAMLGGLSGLTGATMPTTGLGINSIGLGGGSGGVGGGVSSAMAAGISSITGGVSSMGVTSSASSHALADGQYSALTSSTGSANHYSTNANVSPLPSRANPMSTTMPPLCQSTTMPVLSLHNTHSIPSGSASYTLGLSVAPVASSYTFPTHSATTGGLASVLGATSGVTGAGVSGLSGLGSGLGTGTGLNLTSTNPLTSTLGTNLTNYNTSSSYSTYTNPLLSGTGGISSKLNMKPLDELDLLTRYGQRGGTPCSPIPPANWGLDSYTGIDGVNPAFMHTQNRSLIGMELDARSHGLTLNGTGEPQVDMLDIPGKGRCCVFIARFSYDPPDVEGSEGELALCAGDYLLVWGNGEPQGGYFDAELLDGRRGLVPASFVQRLVGDDLLEFHQAVVSTLRDADDAPIPLDPAPLPSSNPLIPHTTEDLARISETHTDLGQDLDDEADTVPAPKHLTLERQLNKSVLIGWSQPDPPMCNQIESYHVYVDGVLKVTVKATERTRALVEGVDSNRPHRISVRSVTQNRRTSRDAACTMIIGRDTAHLGPSAVRATNITCSSAIISWLPANSNHQHVVCVNNVEVRTVKPGVYRHTITGLAPSTQYRVTVRAKHLRAPGQQQAPPAGPPPEEAPGAYTDFRTLAKGLPDPPQIQVEAGPQDGTLLVTWQPVTRPPSSGPVTGYAVYADGKKVTDVDSPTGDHALIDIGKLVGLNPRAVTVRTKSRDSQSADSTPTMIPNQVRAAARNRNPGGAMQPQPGGHMRNQRMMNNQVMGGMNNQMQQMNPNQVIDHDENLSDKEIYPGSMHQQERSQRDSNSSSIPAIEITKDAAGDTYVSDDSEYHDGASSGGGSSRRRSGSHGPPQQQQKPRYFHALFDYDPATMSPNPDACEEELPFNEGDTIKVYGEKDPDGFYWGELRGRRGYVPHNMVEEIEDGAQGGVGPSVRGISRERWGDIYANMPVKRMIALYDYDPQELSPNVDAEVELSFQTGAVILVYGDMDEDGFYMGELDGVRGLVPSNFLTEAPDQYSQQGPAGNNLAQRTLNSNNNRGRGIGPGARGPPPPPRDAMMGGMGGLSQRGPQRKVIIKSTSQQSIE
uniref:RIMS-binding protein 2 n=1 Tax=Anopheles farauti TaxID=69004 RepID=A0A182QRU1_9DIPT